MSESRQRPSKGNPFDCVPLWKPIPTDLRAAALWNPDGAFMTDMAEDGLKADVVIMDPPRAGSDQKFMRAVVKLAPKKVVYVSCNPETLARDLGYFTKHGYRVRKIQPVDMFPHTGHVECCVLLTQHSSI